MKKVFPLLTGVLCVLGSVGAWGANQVVVESKSVAPGATGVQIGVYLENDLEVTGLVLPLEFREISATGAYITNSLSLDPANRLTTFLTGFVIQLFYPEPDNTDPARCNGVGYATSGPVDFVSPDAVLYSAVSTFEPCLPIGDDGAPPGGTPSLVFTFDVTNADGIFLIDTVCIAPANFLVYVDCETVGGVTPVFTAGQVTVGNPVFPPIVDDIPDQTIDEGDAFTAIALDGYVSDLDNTDAEMIWTAAGQTDLSVSINAGRVATITTPDPDWFGTEIVIFTATDPGLQSDSDPVVFTVNPINDPPVLDPLGAQGVLAGGFLQFFVTASDIDNAALTLSLENEPAGASLSSDGAGNGTFSWMTGCLDTGLYAVTIIVSDGVAADTGVVNITVLANPDVFRAQPDSVSFLYEFEGDPPGSVLVSLRDPGCGELPWEATPSEPWLLVSPDTGTTPSTIQLDVDTTGLGIGEYDAVLFVSERVAAKGSVEVVEIPVHLSVAGTICLCPCHGDPQCDSLLNVFDVVRVVEIVFREAFAIGSVDCPFFRADANCDCVLNVFDVVHFVDKAFRESTEPFCGPGGPCDASPPTGPCHDD